MPSSRMLVRAAVAAILLSLGIAVHPAHAAETDLRVGSFNVKDPDKDYWSSRKAAVARDICEEWLDVLGVQEVYETENRQSLASAIETACPTRDYEWSLDITDSDLGKDNRILYRPSKVELLDANYKMFPKQCPTDADSDNTKRALTWAKFRHKTNLRQFVFITAHLAPGGHCGWYKGQQWEELRKFGSYFRSQGLVVIITGDFNTSKFNPPANTMLPRMYSYGFGDVLGQTYQSYSLYKPRAVSRIDVHYNSYNGFDPTPSTVARGRVGNNIDWIFVTNGVKIPRWRTVVHQQNGVLTKPIPSDHFMVTALLRLP